MWLGRFICCSRVILSLAACWLQHHELVQLTTTIIAYLQQIPLVLTFPNDVKKSSCLEETNKEILGAPKEFWFCKRFKNENLMRTERIERKPWSDISNSCKEKPIGCIFMTFNMLLARNQIPCTKVLKSQLHHNKFMAKLLEFNLISELFISMFSRYFNCFSSPHHTATRRSCIYASTIYFSEILKPLFFRSYSNWSAGHPENIACIKYYTEFDGNNALV